MYRDYYRWYYVSKQTRNEPLLVKMFDTDDSVEARCKCPPSTQCDMQLP
jgi:hypothetical protein